MNKQTPRNILESKYEKRRKKLIQGLSKGTAIFSSGNELTLSRDQHYPFMPNSDFFYLTGFRESSSVLVLRDTASPKSVLFLKDRDLAQEKWIGESLGVKRARRRFQISDIRPITELESELPKLLKGSDSVHLELGINELVDRIVISSLKNPSGPRFEQPNIIADSRLLTSEMRLIKDREEIKALSKACLITGKALCELARYIPELRSEKHAQEELETLFTKHGGHGLSFATIVAAGRNATTLHHSPGFSPLWKKDLVLIDSGTKFNGYAADVTRVFPVSGRFSEPQAEIYDIVKDALYDALLKAKPGNCLDDIHQAAIKSLVKGLCSIGLLKGTQAQIISKGEYKKYFMHGTGHWLGLDVHDISPVHYNNVQVPSKLRPFEAGMVFTIEPGLYFDPLDRMIPDAYRGIGIRLEENILITSKGHEVLTKSIPIDRKEIEKLFN